MMKTQTAPRVTRLQSRRGAMLIMVAISMVLLLGLVAIATDIGSGNRFRRIAQNAADAGAIGGGREIERGDTVYANVRSYALRSVIKNGFAASEAIVNNPPASGPFKDSLRYVEVIIGKKTPTYFGFLLGRDSLQVQARAVAGMASNNMNCIFNLASYPSTGIDWPGQMTTNCGVGSNGSVNLSKGLSGGGSVTAVGSISGGPAGASYPGAPPVFDPFPNIPVPAETSCDFTNVNLTANATLNPGVYCGGITVGKNIRATLRAGTYIIRGGGINGGEIDATSGVTIINTNGMGNNQAAYKPITFDNSCSFQIFAPSSGTYKGIAIVIPSAAPESATKSDYVSEYCGKGATGMCDPANPDIRGVVYMPKQSISVGNSNAKLTVAGTVIAKFMTAQNGGAEGCFFSDTSGNSALKRLTLVE